ncbi:MAG: leucine-rich repeat domain-containing protein, partial [Thermoguttaceae bacterium]|nr:leucine-rich repeat domain-containing protein [Thermoguttaceae bacterium]
MTDFKYTVCDGRIEITKYTGSASSVIIPLSIDGLPVTSIGKRAFYECNSLTSVTIPNSVTSIGGGPFAACDKLTEIYVSARNTHFKSVDGILFSADGKTLIQVPRGKGLTEYTIPDGVTSIGKDAFCGCSSLTSVTIPHSVTSIGNWAFSWCASLTSVTIPNSVTSIGDKAFHSCHSLT